jgi:HEAT repeat protein
MSHALLFAKSLSLLLEEVSDGSDLTMVQSGLLRMRRFARSMSLTVTWTGDRFSVNGATVANTGSGLQHLQRAMAEHAISQITVNAGASQTEVLRLAMLLKPRAPDAAPGSSIRDALRDAALWSIQITPLRRIRRGPASPTHAADLAIRGPVQLATRMRALQTVVETALQAHDATTLADTLAAIAAVEADVPNRDVQSLWKAAFDKAATPSALRLMATSLPSSDAGAATMVTVLKRAGEPGAMALLEQLLDAESMEVRRASFDALSEIKAGASHLQLMLTDPRWYVVRNAACLLGLYRAQQAEPDLTAAFAHEDARVRAAIVTALLQLDTPSSRATVRSVIRDESAEVRRRAVRGFVAETGAATNLDTLLLALEYETELDVQLEFLYALGSLASPDAVQRLIRICSTESHRHPTEYRIAAAEALASARLGASVPLLRGMLNDPDQHARAAARHLIRAVS